MTAAEVPRRDSPVPEVPADVLARVENTDVHTMPLPPDWGDHGRFQSLFHQSPVATWLIDVTTGTVYANRATADLFGLPPDQMFVPNTRDVLHPDERDRTHEEIAALLTGALDRVSRDKIYVRGDGSEFVGHLDSTALVNEKGQRWAILCLCRDVTREREAERSLVEREAWFEALVQNNVDAIIVLDADGRLTYGSPGAERLAGRPLSGLIGSSALDLVHPEDLDVVAESFVNTAATPGTAIPLQFRTLRPDGEARLVEAVATNLLDEPAVEGIVVNLRDLTDGLDAANALEISENRFRKMLENISDTVTLVDTDGHVVRTTGNVKNILGYPSEFWSVRNAFDIAHPDDVDLIRRLLVELLEHPERDVRAEIRVLHALGHYEYVEANAANLLDDPEVGAIVITSTNITDRKNTEREVAEARDQALRALEVRNEFVASVSHELRTPIHGILGLTELLATSPNIDQGALQLAESIRRATETLRLVLDDILDFSKIEAGRLELNEQPVSLREMADDLLALFGQQATSKGVRLEVELAEEIPALILADGFRLRQVFSNLVGNAVKFTAEGSVHVRFTSDTATELRVEVSDTGIGMSEEALLRIFEPFSQAHATTAREYGGTGLGLTIARRLIDLMDGGLRVESAPGLGASFIVTVPLRSRPLSGPEREPEAGVQPQVDVAYRVLVVEDNTVNQLLVSRQLDRLGYEPVVVGSGEYALQALREESFDAILMDWQMPGMDGLEATAQIRAFEREDGRDRVPIVAMTASAMPGDRQRCLDAGMDDFIAKPVNLTTLGRVLASWLYPRGVTTDEAEDPGATTTAAVVARDVLVRLAEELDDVELVRTVVTTYLRELPGRLEGIEDAARRSDLDRVHEIAHTLKSTSAAVGAERLAELCADIERRVRSVGLAGSVEPLLARLIGECQRAEQALTAELEAGPLV